MVCKQFNAFVLSHNVFLVATHIFMYQSLDGRSCTALSLTQYRISTVKIRLELDTLVQLLMYLGEIKAFISSCTERA